MSHQSHPEHARVEAVVVADARSDRGDVVDTSEIQAYSRPAEAIRCSAAGSPLTDPSSLHWTTRTPSGTAPSGITPILSHPPQDFRFSEKS